MFGFQKDVTLVSHVPKVGKAVLFLSTMHHTDDIIVEDVKKPISKINKHYNATKSGVDTKVLIGDNLSCHSSEEVLKLGEKENIKFVCFPPNSTHVAQPLDVSFFRPLKRI